MSRAAWAVVWLMASASGAAAQVATIGGGALVSARGTDPVFELHAQTPPAADWRGYVTLSWMRASAAPTVITAAERPVLRPGPAFTGLGAGLLWLEVANYVPEPMLVSSTVVPLPIPRTALVLIASTLPFARFDSSLVLKVGVTLFRGR